MNHEVEKCLPILHTGGTLLYPADTIWGIGCDATNPDAVEKIYRLKKRAENKSLIILLDDSGKLRNFMEQVPELAYDLISYAEKPLTIVYPGARNLAGNIPAEDGSVAIRVVKPGCFCHDLVHAYGKPIVSTSANISGTPNPLSFREISKEILSGVDYVVREQTGNNGEIKASTIIRLKLNGEFIILRK